MTSQPVVARRRQDLPEFAGRELHAQGQQARCTAPASRSILSQLAREGRLSVVDELALEAPEDEAAGAEVQGAWALGLGAGHHRQVDDNLCLASRNLPQVLVVEPREADPVSLVDFKNVLVTQGGGRRSSRRCWHERRRAKTIPKATV